MAVNGWAIEVINQGLQYMISNLIMVLEKKPDSQFWQNTVSRRHDV